MLGALRGAPRGADLLFGARSDAKPIDFQQMSCNFLHFSSKFQRLFNDFQWISTDFNGFLFVSLFEVGCFRALSAGPLRPGVLPLGQRALRLRRPCLRGGGGPRGTAPKGAAGHQRRVPSQQAPRRVDSIELAILSHIF